MIAMTMDRGIDEFGRRRALITTTSTSDAVVIPSEIQKAAVALYTSSKAYVEYTVSSPELIQAGTAKWIKWPLGDVNADAADGIMSVVAAVRAVSVQGDSITLEVVGQ